MAKQVLEGWQVGFFGYRFGAVRHIQVDGRWLDVELPATSNIWEGKSSHRIDIGGAWICRNSDGSWTGYVEDQFGSHYFPRLRTALDWLLYAEKYDPDAQH